MLLDRLESRLMLRSVATRAWAYVQDRELVVVSGFFGADMALTVSNGVAQLSAKNGIEGEPDTRQTLYSRKGTNFHRVRVELSDNNDAANITSDLPLTVKGHGGNDRITISARNARVQGGVGDDTLVSSPPLLTGEPEQPKPRNVGRSTMAGKALDMIAPTYNVLEGNAGDDRIETRGGDDEVHGGAGRDTLVLLNHGVEVHRGRPEAIGYFPEYRQVTKSRVGLFSVEAIETLERSNPILVKYNQGLEQNNTSRPIAVVKG